MKTSLCILYSISLDLSFSVSDGHYVLPAPFWSQPYEPCADVIVSFLALRNERQVCLENKQFGKQTCTFCERCIAGAPQALIKFMADAEIHTIQHIYVRQPGWCRTYGVFPTADGCSLLTGRETSAQMQPANDPPHRGTEQR